MMPFRLTRAVKVIAIACFASFIIQQTADQFLGQNLQSIFALIPSSFILEKKFWQIFTYAFLHGDVLHLFLNLLMLVFVGAEIEGLWGWSRFVRYYMFCAVAAGALYLLLQAVIWGGQGLQTPMVGASGAIYGLLMAYGLLFGERVLLFMLLFPMKAKHFVWILAGVEFMTTVFSGRGGLSSAAHLGGMIAGFGYLWANAAWRISQRRRKEQGPGAGWNFLKRAGKKARPKSHLKLVINNKKGLDSDSDQDQDDPKTWH